MDKKDRAMRVMTPVLYAAIFGAAIYLAVSQSPLPEAAASAPSDNATTPLATATTPGRPVRVGKRETCKQAVTSKKLRRGEARDQMQICIAQARVECLQQAVDQKLRGAARRVYVKSCVAT